MIEVLNSFWAFEFGGILFQTLAVLECIGYLNLGSRFQDLDMQTNEIWVSRPRQMDRRDLGFRTSTDGHTGFGFQDLDKRADRLTELIYMIVFFQFYFKHYINKGVWLFDFTLKNLCTWGELTKRFNLKQKNKFMHISKVLTFPTHLFI